MCGRVDVFRECLVFLNIPAIVVAIDRDVKTKKDVRELMRKCDECRRTYREKICLKYISGVTSGFDDMNFFDILWIGIGCRSFDNLTSKCLNAVDGFIHHVTDLNVTNTLFEKIKGCRIKRAYLDCEPWFIDYDDENMNNNIEPARAMESILKFDSLETLIAHVHITHILAEVPESLSLKVLEISSQSEINESFNKLVSKSRNTLTDLKWYSHKIPLVEIMGCNNLTSCYSTGSEGLLVVNPLCGNKMYVCERIATDIYRIESVVSMVNILPVNIVKRLLTKYIYEISIE